MLADLRPPNREPVIALCVGVPDGRALPLLLRLLHTLLGLRSLGMALHVNAVEVGDTLQTVPVDEYLLMEKGLLLGDLLLAAVDVEAHDLFWELGKAFLADDAVDPFPLFWLSEHNIGLLLGLLLGLPPHLFHQSLPPCKRTLPLLSLDRVLLLLEIRVDLGIRGVFLVREVVDDLLCVFADPAKPDLRPRELVDGLEVVALVEEGLGRRVAPEQPE